MHFHLFSEFGQISGCWLGVGKCGVILQGITMLVPVQVIAGIKIRCKVKCLGTWLGHVSLQEQFYGPIAKLQTEAPFLASEKAAALCLWAFPVLRRVACQFFPTIKVVWHANMAMWHANMALWHCIFVTCGNRCRQRVATILVQ